jgi:hypothetical protein
VCPCDSTESDFYKRVSSTFCLQQVSFGRISVGEKMSDNSDRRDLIAQRRAGNIGGEKMLEQDSFGKKALELMGWEEGLGVGRSGKGVAEPLKVKRLKTDAGLGMTDEIVSDAWIENVTGFSAVLTKLNATFAKKVVVEVEEEEKEEDSKKKKKKKKKKSKKSKKDSSSSKEAAEDVVVRGAGVISQKRLRAKNMHSFSHEDLQAILGKSLDESKPVQQTTVVVTEEIYSGMFVRAKK